MTRRRRLDFFVLVGREPRRVDVLEWGAWFEAHKRDLLRIVGRTEVGRGWVVSTVFLGLNHQFGEGPPLIFETLIMGPRRVPKPLRDYADWMRRYSTWPEAEAGHHAAVAMLRAVVDAAAATGGHT